MKKVLLLAVMAVFISLNAFSQLGYEIISEKPHVDSRFGFNKCNIEVRLLKKITKDELTKIGYQIRSTRKSYDKLWIFYNIKGKSRNNGAWATTHFTPNLEVWINEYYDRK